jgi:hypothetical protein
MSEERKQQILDAIKTELATSGGRMDPLALATAIDAALGGDTLEAGPSPANINGAPAPGSSPKGAYARSDEGKTPDELNASNDDGRG